MHLIDYLDMKWISVFLLCFLSLDASAGFVEVGISGNYRKSSIDANNYQESLSYTGSLTYYFWEMSAIEMSYTNGISNASVKPGTDARTDTITGFELTGLDFILTLADRESVVQPYVKVGGAYIKKKIVKRTEGIADTRDGGSSEGLVPSAGVGFKIKFTKELSLKVGVDAWTSPPKQEPVIVDFAGRVGLSWMF